VEELDLSASSAPAAVVNLPPSLVINLPFWSTLMLEFDARPPTAGHHQELDIPPLTSTEANGDACLITRPCGDPEPWRALLTSGDR
jgi:hypothetical protein